ncbi:2OG-Fe(II) oxygenase [Burkholderia pseudomultivorans]|uniref:Prolyl 4-hydroxylase n=1 Tax=Burkholderia pseudomultivorans TaxID=1207504 RepID=A0A132EK11_9BURK|nr:2OG-Fe(II) oxygenase [Burkholderia pseudomultivorans]KWF30871.1 prolyl 4-hydroxylase [Burkholderia pseudomultivorans]
MTDISLSCAAPDWTDMGAQLDSDGYALLSGAFDPDEVRELARRITADGVARRVSLDSLELGRGEIGRFGAQLPEPLASWRAALYRDLAPIANRWNETLGVQYRYPPELDTFLQRTSDAGQNKPLCHLNRLGVGDYLALHQSSDGEHVFPMQVVVLLSEPGEEFAGGEFVLTEQRPRMQSRPMVLPLALGDAAIIGTAQRPFKGSRGYYRVNLKHAISRVRDGERLGVELSFHHAP